MSRSHLSSIPYLRRLFGKLRRASPACSPGEFEVSSNDLGLLVPDDVRASFHKDGVALIHLSSGKVFLSNETGSRIWQGLVSGLSPEAIGEQISREFGVASELVRSHMASFLSELEQRGLIIRKAEV